MPAGNPLHLGDYGVALVAKIMCYAICALAMDLIWGYTGILSLGHGLYFALGGYAMGMYLMRQIGHDGNYRSDLPDFMVFLDWKALPWTWAGSASLRVPAVPGGGRAGAAGRRVRLVRVPLAHQGRVLLDHHAGARPSPAMLLFFRNETGFGGNNGFTDFKRILGVPIALPSTRMVLFVLTGCTLVGFYLLARAIVNSKFGRVLQAIRDAETRVMFTGYDPLQLQAVDLGAVGGDVRRRRRAVRAAGGHHQPERDVAGGVDRDGDLGRRRRPRHAGRAHRSARSSSTAPRAGSRRRSPSSGCTSSARCSSR